MKKRTRRNYTQEFKEEALKLITNQMWVGDITFIWPSEG